MKDILQKNQSAQGASHGTVLLRWTAPEYQYHEKGMVWKILAAVAVLSMITYGILAHSYPFAIVILLFAGVYFLLHKEPQEIEIRVTDMGIQVGQRFYEYSHIRHFWILFRPGEVESVNMRLMKEVIKECSLLLGNQDPAELRTVLSRFIPELAGKDESFVDWLARKLRL